MEDRKESLKFLTKYMGLEKEEDKEKSGERVIVIKVVD